MLTCSSIEQRFDLTVVEFGKHDVAPRWWHWILGVQVDGGSIFVPTLNTGMIITSTWSPHCLLQDDMTTLLWHWPAEELQLSAGGPSWWRQWIMIIRWAIVDRLTSYDCDISNLPKYGSRAVIHWHFPAKYWSWNDLFRLSVRSCRCTYPLMSPTCSRNGIFCCYVVRAFPLASPGSRWCPIKLSLS